MITDDVIKEIYHKFNHERRPDEDLRIDYFANLLKPHHTIKEKEDEIIIENLEEYNPFKRFLKRRLNTILEFDKTVAFVFSNHILFFDKTGPDMRVHFRPEEQHRSIWSKIFGCKTKE